MYPTLIFLHSLTRWLVVGSLLYVLFRAGRGYVSKKLFSGRDGAARTLAVTAAHLQLVIGMTLYGQSPLVRQFWGHFREAWQDRTLVFFGLAHMLLMLTAVVLLTIGSALSKRKQEDRQKFKTMLAWFGIALLVLFIAIPWPFSPFANRPYFR
ncbi:hypothetical protein V9K67_01610 [Paraflavisolibacter sp. H34]|uniref:hypothetical protein n=1 Tax=Huijunlia imazamoxiresistens TaxID=3127457 RepID=UPI003018150A